MDLEEVEEEELVEERAELSAAAGVPEALDLAGFPLSAFSFCSL